MGKLIIDGNSVYEIDEVCMNEKETEPYEESFISKKDTDIKNEKIQ